MPISVRDGESWKQQSGVWVRDSESWKQASGLFVRDGEAWSANQIQTTASEILVPVSDVDAGGFIEGNGDGDGILWDEVDETPADDGTSYIVSSFISCGGSDTVTFGISDASASHSASQTHVLSARAMAYNVNGSSNPKIRIQLLSSSGWVLADSGLDSMYSELWHTYDYTLTSSEAQSVADENWSGLQIRVRTENACSDTTFGNYYDFRLSQCQLDIQ